MSDTSSEGVLHPVNPPLAREANVPKDNGQTRVLADGSLVYNEPITNTEVPAVRLQDIRPRLVEDASRTTGYTYDKKRGFEDTNVTAFLENDKDYGVRRENWPDRLFQIYPDGSKGEKPDGYVMDQGRIVLDAFDHGLRNFGDQLPMYVSSELEGHDIEDYLRRNREISVYDLVARAPNGYFKGKPEERSRKGKEKESQREWNVGPPRVGTFSMRATRFRLRAGCLSWERKDGTAAKNQRILSVIPAEFKAPAVNSTKGWRDLNKAEIKSIESGKMKKPQQGPKRKRADVAEEESNGLEPKRVKSTTSAPDAAPGQAEAPRIPRVKSPPRVPNAPPVEGSASRVASLKNTTNARNAPSREREPSRASPLQNPKMKHQRPAARPCTQGRNLPPTTSLVPGSRVPDKRAYPVQPPNNYKKTPPLRSEDYNQIFASTSSAVYDRYTYPNAYNYDAYPMPSNAWQQWEPSAAHTQSNVHRPDQQRYHSLAEAAPNNVYSEIETYDPTTKSYASKKPRYNQNGCSVHHGEQNYYHQLHPNSPHEGTSKRKRTLADEQPEVQRLAKRRLRDVAADLPRSEVEKPARRRRKVPAGASQGRAARVVQPLIPSIPEEAFSPSSQQEAQGSTWLEREIDNEINREIEALFPPLLNKSSSYHLHPSTFSNSWTGEEISPSVIQGFTPAISNDEPIDPYTSTAANGYHPVPEEIYDPEESNFVNPAHILNEDIYNGNTATYNEVPSQDTNPYTDHNNFILPQSQSQIQYTPNQNQNSSFGGVAATYDEVPSQDTIPYTNNHNIISPQSQSQFQYIPNQNQNSYLENAAATYNPNLPAEDFFLPQWEAVDNSLVNPVVVEEEEEEGSSYQSQRFHLPPTAAGVNADLDGMTFGMESWGGSADFDT